jgi:hypothetical protein
MEKIAPLLKTLCENGKLGENGIMDEKFKKLGSSCTWMSRCICRGSGTKFLGEKHGPNSPLRTWPNLFFFLKQLGLKIEAKLHMDGCFIGGSVSTWHGFLRKNMTLISLLLDEFD